MQSPGEFLASLSAAAPAWGLCDLATAAGLTVNGVPSPKKVLDASGGTAVIFEVEDEAGGHPWIVVYDHCGSPQKVTLRRKQLAARFNDRVKFGLVASAVARGAGVIDFEGTDLRVVLFICGENNALSPKTRSIFKRSPTDPTEAAKLRAVLAGRWVMLNPAHVAYYPHALPTGFGKVGVVQMGKDRQAGPTLAQLAERDGRYRDGTSAPLAVVHVNNYDRSHDETEEYAAVAFGRGDRVRRVAGPIAGEVADTSDGTRPWRAYAFEISTAAD